MDMKIISQSSWFEGISSLKILKKKTLEGVYHSRIILKFIN